MGKNIIASLAISMLFFSMIFSSLLFIPSASALALNGYSYSGQYWNIAPGQAISYYIYRGGSPDITDGSDLVAVRLAFQTWENIAGSYLDFSFVGETDTHASLQNGVNDGVSVVDFLNRGVGGPIAETWRFPFTGNPLTESDMILNEDWIWSTNIAPNTYDVQNTVTHEAGHFLRLLDLAYTDVAVSEQTMFNVIIKQEVKKRTLEWGDIAGVRYIYPNIAPVGGGGIGYETQGGDLAVGNVNDLGSVDMISLWVDNPSGGNSIKYRAGMDLDSMGNTGTWTGTKTMPVTSGPVGDETSGAGVALGNIDANPKPDMVVLWVDNPSGANTIYYQIGWNLDSSGNPTGSQPWSDRKTVPSSDVGYETQGAGVTIANLDSNSQPEMIVAWVDNPSGGNDIWYKVGWNLDSSGNPTGSQPWSDKFHKGYPPFNDWVGSETSGAGVSIANIGGNSALDIIIFWIDNPSGPNHGYWQVGYDINGLGEVTSWDGYKAFPGDWQWVGHETSGAGVAAIDMDNNERSELFFLWVDNPSGDNYANYRIEWGLTGPLFFDDFSGNLGQWNSVRGSWIIESGELSQNENRPPGSWAIITSTNSFSNFIYKGTMVIKDNVDWIKGMAFRYQDSSNYYYFTLDTGSQMLFLRKVYQGGSVDLASTAFSPVQDVYYDLMVKTYGGNMEVFVDEELRVSAHDSTFLSGKIALIADRHTHFDNIEVHTNNPYVSPIVQLREHKRFSSYNVDVQFSKPDASSLKTYSTTSSIGRGYAFVVFDRAWLNGKTLKFTWSTSSSYSGFELSAKIYDGAYVRSNDADFPTGSEIPLKGNGVLQSLESHYGTTGAHSHNYVINVAGGSQSEGTLFFTVWDQWSGQYGSFTLEYLAVLGSDGTPLWEQTFDVSILMEKTGSQSDYGRIE